MWRPENNNYCIRKDKVTELKARTEIQFARETMGGKGWGANCARQEVELGEHYYLW